MNATFDTTQTEQSVATFECFHVTRRLPYGPQSDWEVGQKRIVGRDDNPFFGFYENARSYPLTLATGEVIQVPAIRFLTGVQSGEITPNNLPAAAVEIAKHYLMLAHELIYEEVRLTAAPLLPSRKRCLWTSDSLEQSRDWAGNLGGECKILRLEVTGSRHVADSNLLLADSEPLSETYHKAGMYWRGERSAQPFLETLVSGQLTVLEVVH